MIKFILYIAVTNDDEANIISPMLDKRMGAMMLIQHRGAGEAIEAVAHGNETTSRVVGRVIDEIKLPPSTIIGAVARGDDVMIANDNWRIEQSDHVIMFLTDKKYITDVERLFQPSTFFL